MSFSHKYSTNSAVFYGDSAKWQKYLELSAARRYDHDTLVGVTPNQKRDCFTFVSGNKNAESEKLASLLQEGFSLFSETLKEYPATEKILKSEVFSNKDNTIVPVHIRYSKHLPSDAAREISLGDDLGPQTVSIVINDDLFHHAANALNTVSRENESKRLGILWGLVGPVLHELGHSNLPRDRFFEEIHQVWRDCLVMRNILFKNQTQNGFLVPNAAGRKYIECYTARLFENKSEGPEDDLFSLPFFKMLNQLNSLLREDTLKRYDKLNLFKIEEIAEPAKVIIRGYLDDKYLRPSLSQAMSAIPEAYLPMAVVWKNKEPVTPPPKVGRYGIEDEEDFSAWNKVAKKFRKIGLLITCQLGIGEFGRVYEAVNLSNPSWPQKVAVKVDRIYKTQRDKAIQVEDVMLKLSRDLSHSPHVIRVFDVGLLSKKNTYHVLQLVAEGETLDELLGVGREEPTSRPNIFSQESIIQKLKQKLFKPVNQPPTKKDNRFARPLTIIETIDVMISILLWVEKVHALGYSINDVKTGNIMINCRGLVKGIDLDFYQKTGVLPQVLMQDFFLLSWSCLLLLINAPRKTPIPVNALKDTFGPALQGGASPLRTLLAEKWAFPEISPEDGKDILDCFVDIIIRSRFNAYGKNSDLFEQDINRLIGLKRFFFEREIILTFPELYNRA
ncbi:hypothetical protein [uncultured Desulfosarcina sp.]|uniref:hypothetical protein n=1 Tax=uncultured Desulfosarcina sp. TaxID=218289 RepID=UPI0029C71444|nr:hypothetical protein [uncultured Desulfosarcina sp.]